jgi:hypothetical protein
MAADVIEVTFDGAPDGGRRPAEVHGGQADGPADPPAHREADRGQGQCRNRGDAPGAATRDAENGCPATGAGLGVGRFFTG